MKKYILTAVLFLVSAFFNCSKPVRAAALQITTPNPSSAAVGQPYSFQLQASGGTAPYTWSTLSTNYPSGCCVMGISSSGVLNTQSSNVVLDPAGTFFWNVSVSDASGNVGTGTITLVVNSAPRPILILSDTFATFNYTIGNPVPNAIVTHISNNSTSQTINYSIAVPNQPAWLNSAYASGVLPLAPLQSAGVGISVNPAGLAPGSYTAIITFTGNFSNSPASIPVTLNVASGGSSASNLNISPLTLPAAVIGSPYSTTLQISGGTAPYTLSVLSTTYPSACCILGIVGNDKPSSTGAFTFNTQSSQTVTGNPGNYSWTLQITDATGATATKTISLALTNSVPPPPNKPTLILSSNAVNYNYTQGQPVPQTTQLNIFNQSTAQTANFNISAPNQPAWLNTTYASSTLSLAPGQVMGLGVAVDPTKVGPGSYRYNIALTGDFANSPLNISVSLNVIAGVADPIAGNLSNFPNGTVIQLPGNPTVYLVTNGQLRPFSSAQEFLSAGYNWSDIKQVTPSQVAGASGFFPYPSGSLINDNGTIFFIAGHSKVPFTSADAFTGLGYSFRNVVQGDLTNYALSSYMINTANAEHPWGSWLIYKGTVYYSTKGGLIGVPSADIFTANGGNWSLLVKANSFDIAALNANPNLPLMTVNDSRLLQ